MIAFTIKNTNLKASTLKEIQQDFKGVYYGHLR